jgi:hypothetical protein
MSLTKEKEMKTEYVYIQSEFGEYPASGRFNRFIILVREWDFESYTDRKMNANRVANGI